MLIEKVKLTVEIHQAVLVVVPPDLRGKVKLGPQGFLIELAVAREFVTLNK